MHLTIVDSLMLALPAVISAQGLPSSQTGTYTDVDTGIRLYGNLLSNGYRFGMVMPKEPTTDFIVQLVSPLLNGVGWGGISFQSSMRGPLLLVAWPDGDKVMTAPRVATGYTPSSVVPYTANPISLIPIQQGTFVNNTHVSSTFLCGGCINQDSFDPAWSNTGSVFFSYAYSQTTVKSPSNIDTALSAHTGKGGGYAAFRVELSEAASEKYEKYAALASPGNDNSGGSGRTETVTPTSNPTPASGPEASSTATEMPDWESGVKAPKGSDFSHRKITPLMAVGLTVLGVVYLAQPFMIE
ncbi:hypothetical protein MFIFM68171_06502 [Madurella fahalii]|uniref:Cellobiose dehydrogenase-like cytochrome domain-containing protein n=1 Tax=Madurella fahalii TaxID=1157608 RepID=A0ABQ0GEV2_9PEZI